MNIVDFTEFIVKGLVKEPDLVKVQSFESDDEGTTLEIIVCNSDMGAVIGKGGKMASAIRTLVQAHAYLNDHKRVRI
ncbi:MAG: KH domain-containing protein, partial [Bacilli bacterium]